MKDIDWDKFAERVPSGTHCKTRRASPYDRELRLALYFDGYEGIIIEPLIRDERHIRIDCARVQLFEYGRELDVPNISHDLLYFIDGQYRTFSEVMA